jgi:ABC-2 type transport system permease protein
MLDTTISRGVDEQVLASALASAPTAQSRPARPSALSASLTLGWRAVLKLKHVPSQLIDATLFPILMTLMFTYVFGGALAGSVEEYLQQGSVEEYLQQLIPGILVLTVAMSSSYTALGLNRDIEKGIFDRFRSLPFWRPAVLVGALLGDMVRYTITALVIIVLGLILGFRPEAGLSGVLLSLSLVLVFAFSLSWVWTTVGLLMDDAESAMMVSQLTSFPLLFISNVFVDSATMPEFLQKFMNISPISLTVTAIRGLIHGNVTTTQIAYVFLSCAILIAIFAPLTMHLYNNKNAV